jgi:hypothetical protein
MGKNEFGVGVLILGSWIHCTSIKDSTSNMVLTLTRFRDFNIGTPMVYLVVSYCGTDLNGYVKRSTMKYMDS